MTATPEGVARLWRELEQSLVARREAVQSQIRAYPYPIPACDAQYNHLLEQRSAIGEAIVEAREAMSSGTDGETALGTMRRIARRVPGVDATRAQDADDLAKAPRA